VARSTPGADTAAVSESVIQLRRKERRTDFRQSRCDRSTMLASACLHPNRHTVEPMRDLHQVQTDASVTIRPPIPTPAQRLNNICAETDILAADAAQGPIGGCVRVIWGALSKYGWGSAFLAADIRRSGYVPATRLKRK
jgi:hypothetical protein